MSIQITITGANAAETVQLVQDLASTMRAMDPADIPAKTEVSTVQDSPAQTAPSAQQMSPAAPVQQAPTAPAQPPVQNGASIATVPTAPTASQQALAPQQATAPQQPAATSVPTSAPTYDFNQIATATMQLQQAGQNIFEIFGQFGIQALNQLPKERYGEYAAVLRQRGAKI